MYDTVIYEVDDPVATITLNRPEAMNAWTNRMDREIRDAVARASADPAVVGIIITGAGRAFCAGADMKLLSNISSGDESSNDAGSAVAEGEAAADSNGDFDGRFPFLMTTPKPIIAAINGAVAGMAFPFSLCCDLRVGSEKSLFLTAFAQRGLIAEWGLGWLLPKLVGPSVALDLLMSSRRVTGVEAKELGLLNHIVDNPDDVTVEVDESGSRTALNVRVGDGDLVERQQSQFRQVFQVTQAVIRKRHVRSGPVVGAVGDPREAFASKRCRVQMQNL